MSYQQQEKIQINQLLQVGKSLKHMGACEDMLILLTTPFHLCRTAVGGRSFVANWSHKLCWWGFFSSLSWTLQSTLHHVITIIIKCERIASWEGALCWVDAAFSGCPSLPFPFTSLEWFRQLLVFLSWFIDSYYRNSFLYFKVLSYNILS